MPRNSGIYSIPLGTEGVPDTTIESEPYNIFLSDVEYDLNLPRPILAGGTGASTAEQARLNLGILGTTGNQVLEGNITIESTAPKIDIIATTPTGNGTISGSREVSPGVSKLRWMIEMPTGEAESTGNVGSNFQIKRFGDDGVLLSTVLKIDRASARFDITAPVKIVQAATQTRSLWAVNSRADTSVTDFHDVAIFGECGVYGLQPVPAHGFRAKFRASVAGVGTFQHTGDVTYAIAGIYGWVPAGGHGSGTMAGFFDRADSNAAVILGGSESNAVLQRAIRVWDYGNSKSLFDVEYNGHVRAPTKLFVGVPTDNAALNVKGTSTWATYINGFSATTHGLLIDAGSTATEAPLQIRNFTGVGVLFDVRGNGAVNIPQNIPITTNGTGSLVVAGGASVAGNFKCASIISAGPYNGIVNSGDLIEAAKPSSGDVTYGYFQGGIAQWRVGMAATSGSFRIAPGAAIGTATAFVIDTGANTSTPGSMSAGSFHAPYFNATVATAAFRISGTTIIQRSDPYTYFYSPDNLAYILLGSDTSNYYHNNVHYFRNRAAATQLTIAAANDPSTSPTTGTARVTGGLGVSLPSRFGGGVGIQPAGFGGGQIDFYGVGTSLGVDFPGGAGGDWAINIRPLDGHPTHNFIGFFNSGMGIVGAITGTESSLTFTNLSDIRLKSDLQPFTKATEIIDALRVYDHAWRDGSRGVGVAAQEANEVYPHAIVPGDDDLSRPGAKPWMTDYTRFVPVLIAALQEANERIAQLEKRVH